MTTSTEEKKSYYEKLKSLSEDEILELCQIQEELENRVRQNPLKYFWPHQKNCDGTNCQTATIEFETFDGKKHTINGCPQCEFINTSADIAAFFGSNRSGKTTSNVVKIGFLTTGQYPDWYTGRKFRGKTKGRIFVKDYGSACRVVTDKLHDWLPQDCYIHAPRRNNQGAEVEWTIKHENGGLSFFDIMTYEQKTEAAEGADQDWVYFDEPPPRALYIAATRGLIDRDGICMFGLTPLKEPWLFDEIYNAKNPNIMSVICDMRHNLERYNPLSKQIIGLKEASIRKFEQKLTEEERETRMHGKFRYLAGRIWKEWEREIHTFDRTMWVAGKDGVIVNGQPPAHWARCMLIDPHDRNPHALIWIACDETNNFWAYREAYLPEMIIKDVVSHIKRVETLAREKIALRMMDPNFGPKRYANRGLTVRDEFELEGRDMQYPIRFMFGGDASELGRDMVAKLLKFNRALPLSLTNHPQLRVASDLRECIYEVEHYIWDEYKSNPDSRDPKQAPKDINTHFPDLLRYFALSNFSWHKPLVGRGKGRFD